MPANDHIQAQVEGLATLLVLADEIRKLNNLREFAFFSTNETHRLIPYHTAYLWQKKEFIGIQLIMQSGTAEIDVHTSTNQWINHTINKILETNVANQIQQIQADPSNVNITSNWPENLPPYMLWCPLVDKTNHLTGGLLFFREFKFTDSEIKMLTWLISSYQYTWTTLTKTPTVHGWQQLKEKPHLIALGIIILSILFFPVRLSVLGTGTVSPKTPVLINAPMQGIIKSIAVEPGKQVSAGEVLFSMDKTDLQASAEVSEKDLMLTKTKLRAVIHEGFNNKSSNSEAPILQAQLAIDQAHLDYINAQLAKADVKSPIAGIVIFDSRNDWLGQPVRTGERIFVVANPHEVALKISIPVSDIIKLEKGSPGDFFLFGTLNPLPIKVKTLGYNAKLMPNRILSYQLEADFVDSTSGIQIGSQGTVKLYGRYVPFIYYLVRRPLQAMRQNLGI